MQKGKPFRISSRKLLHSPIVIVLLFVVVLYMGYSVIELFGKYRDVKSKERTAAASLNEAETREAQVQAALDAMSTSRGREEVIREKFNVAKEGEGVVVIPSDDGSGNGSTTTTPKKSFWSRWFSN